MFEKTKQRVDSYTLNVYGHSMELKYRIKTYQYIENQDKQYIKLLKDAGATITTYRKMDAWTNNVTVRYYMLIDDFIAPFEDRVKVVKGIMDTEIESDGVLVTVRDFINEKWERNTNKTTAVELMDKEAVMLDYLSSYVVADLGLEDEYTIISPEKIVEFDKKICYGLSNGKEESLGIKKPEIKTFAADNIPAPKPMWKSSKTYRLYDLFTFDNKKNNEWRIRIEREFDATSNVKLYSKWCRVNTDNEFTFEGVTYKLHVDEYNGIVVEDDSYKNKYGMDEVFVVIQGDKFKVYNSDIFEIDLFNLERLSYSVTQS